ncbi:MAG: hypothetical protein AAF404_09860 [Pseudomonadota bacterium]
MLVKLRERNHTRGSAESLAVSDQKNVKATKSLFHRCLLFIAFVTIVVSILLVMLGVTPGMSTAYHQFIDGTDQAPAQ